MPSRDDTDYARKVHEKAVIEKRQMAIERAASAAEAGAEEALAGEPPPTHVITLEHGDHLDSTLYRFEKGCYLQFCPGPSLMGRKVYLYTNYVLGDAGEYGAREASRPLPADDDGAERAEFVRSQYYGLAWREGAAGGPGRALGAGVLVTDADLYCQLRLRRAGSFHYYFVYDNAESPVGPQGSGWFGVEPTLRVGPGGREALPLDAITCQTVLAKCLGPLERWESVLRVTKESGYNMVHFTPIQELGASDSSYSIANRLRLDPRYGEASFADVEGLATKMRTEWGMLSICDVVLNHTANETAWLETHPEASYNCANCPHLRPAALLDALLARLSAGVARGEYAARGVPARIAAPAHVDAARALLAELVPAARLHEFYVCDADKLAQEFYFLARNKVPAVKPPTEDELARLRLEPGPAYERLGATVDMELALRLYNVYGAEGDDEEARLRRCREELRRRLERLNEAAAEAARAHLRAAVDNVAAGLRYERLQAEGRSAEVSAARPLAPPYFTWWAGAEDAAPAALEAALRDSAAMVMAHNGWVMDADPLVDFAASPDAALVYLRRELIAWGDSVKLRYGGKPEDSPFLWAHMREYVELTAELFDGIRLDNCHSTPLHVAEYMVDCARNVKPDLYVLAELFTNSDHVDNIFVNRLGITSLVREAQAAGDARELGRLLHRFGGRPVGAFLPARRRAARARVAHAMLLDLTHDNPAPTQRRGERDAPACAALAAAAACAAGSTRGYDELLPHRVHVVNEARLYAAWADAGAGAAGAGAGAGTVGAAAGMLALRRALCALHAELARGGYDEVFVDQLDADVLAVTRHEPRERKSVIIVAFTAFTPSEEPRQLAPLRFEGRLEAILLEAEFLRREAPAFAPHARFLGGPADVSVALRRDVPLAESRAVAAAPDGELRFRPLRPGAVLAVRVGPAPAAAAALAELGAALAAPDPYGLAPALAELDLLDFNALLYRCDAEEREAGGGGVYDVPGHGPLVYAGLQGAASLLAEVAADDALGHPLCANLRAGDWLAEYTAARLEREPRLARVAAAYRAALRPLAALPRYLRPAYTTAVLDKLYRAVTDACAARLAGGSAACAGRLGRALALTGVQLLGAVRSAPLPPPSPALPPPRPRPGSLAAGLPHFAVGHMRCWGRDTFVALPGLLLLPGRHAEARAHLLAYGACLRHGLVPNLLAGGAGARYNSRDAVWWWLHAVRAYVRLAPGGAALLAEPVPRLFPSDDAEPQPPGAADQPLHDTVQEALERHFQGVAFRERGAGRDVDAHMTDRGFSVAVGVDPDTGFPFGGNDANCGTWMDKMGSSERAGNRGRPATPRDGSAIELVALAYAAVAFLAELHRAGRYPYPGVVRRHRDGSLTSWTWRQWADRIRHNFERHFWVPPAPSAADARPDLVHRRGIYKDSHGASQPWADYQLRCNFPVAMAVAPELFDPKHAWLALDNAERLLLGPLGLKTLDPADWNYRPEYDNANDGDDPAVAHGFNYHQGPEWTWPLGFYLRARLAFAHECGRHARTVAAAYAALGPALAELRASPWRGLPELAGPGGAPCAHSCRTQAWSSGAALEALHELHEQCRARPLSPD